MTSGGAPQTRDNFEELRPCRTAAPSAAEAGPHIAHETQLATSRTPIKLRGGPKIAEAPEVFDGELDELRHEIEQLRAALATRDLIWSAKTIIAATTGADPDEAHRLLVRQSQHENRKLREVAADIVSRHRRAAS